MKKRLLSTLLASIMLLCFIVPSANAVSTNIKGIGEIVEVVNYNGWICRISETGDASIAGYSGDSTNVTLPTSVKGHKIVALSSNLLSDKNLFGGKTGGNVTSLTIPDVNVPMDYPTLRQYFYDAFSQSTNLKEVTIGSMFATGIPYMSFRWSPNLKKVTFTEDFTKKALSAGKCIVDEYSFADCPSIKTFEFPEGVTEIRGKSFENDMVENFIFPTTVDEAILSGMLIYDSSIACIKNVVVKGETSLVNVDGDAVECLNNPNFYCSPNSLTQEFANYFELHTIDIGSVNIDELVESLWKEDENPSSSDPSSSDPSSSDPSSSDPSSSDPSSSDPSSSDPSSSDPPSSDPSSSEDPASSKTSETTTVPITPVKYQNVGTLNKTMYVKSSTSDFSMGKGVTYVSTNKKVVTVASNGVIKAVKRGNAYIKILNKKNNTSVYVRVKVINPKLNKTSVTIKRGKSYTLKITGKVGKAKFSSSNKKVAKVNKNGKITVKKKAKKNKTAVISVKTNGVTLKCKVKVK